MILNSENAGSQINNSRIASYFVLDSRVHINKPGELSLPFHKLFEDDGMYVSLNLKSDPKGSEALFEKGQECDFGFIYLRPEKVFLYNHGNPNKNIRSRTEEIFKNIFSKINVGVNTRYDLYDVGLKREIFKKKGMENPIEASHDKGYVRRVAIADFQGRKCIDCGTVTDNLMIEEIFDPKIVKIDDSQNCVGLCRTCAPKWDELQRKFEIFFPRISLCNLPDEMFVIGKNDYRVIFEDALLKQFNDKKVIVGVSHELPNSFISTHKPKGQRRYSMG